jgi:copper resistance protein B
MKAVGSSVGAHWLATFAVVIVSASTPALAQSMPGHDLSSMPGMDMGPQQSTREDGAKPPSKKPAGKKSKAKDAAASPAPPMDMPMKEHDMSSLPDMPKDAGHDAMPGMDHGAMQMSPDQPPMDMPVTKPGGTAPSGSAASMGAMQGGQAPADARDPDAYADGLEMGHMPGMDMADDAKHLYVLIDRLEATRTHDGHGQALDGQAWYGGDLDKLWLKVDGERGNGRLGATRTEALWNHAIATYWGLQTGVRQDFGDGPGRTWGSFGVQGLSSYWFDVQATAYVGEGGRTALRFETEYDLLLTQRLILQPDVKVDVFGRDDPRRGIGAGLSAMEAGLRMRYEITRKIAPYVGVVWNRKFGNTARFARRKDGPVREVETVAGVRFWF